MRTKMKITIFPLLLLLFIAGCNTTFLNHKDYAIRLSDLNWNRKIEDQVGQIYIKGSQIIFGRNYGSTFIEISSENGEILNTLKPYIIEKERKPLILDSNREFKDGYSLYDVAINDQRYLKVTLKAIERQYRGDTETFYLIVKTIDGQKTVLFNRDQFTFISDITYFRDGKFILTFNGEAATDKHKYFNQVGLLDLNKIMRR